MITELKEIAKSKEGEILSTSFISTTDKLNWKCKEGHEWQASLLSVQHGAWCEDCYFDGKTNVDPRKQNLYEANKKYSFVYKITNLINFKIYIGVHCTNYLDDGYMGSGKYLRKSIRKHGLDNFKIEPLEYFPDSRSALAREKQIVTKEFIAHGSNYNTAEGGGGGFVLLSKKALSNISKANKGKVTCINSKGETFRVTKEEFDADPTLIGVAKGLFTVKDKEGNVFTIDKKDPRVLSGELVSIMQGMTTVKDSSGKRFQVAKDDPRISSGELVGTTKGDKQTDSANNNRRNSQTGVAHPQKRTECIYCKKEATIGVIGYWHNNNCPFKDESNPEETRKSFKTVELYKKHKLNPKKIAKKNFPKVICKYCEKEVAIMHLSQFHNEKCNFFTGKLGFRDIIKVKDHSSRLVRDLNTGELNKVTKEEFETNSDLVLVSKGILMLQDSKGKIYRVEKNDPRLRTGELLPLKENLVIVEDSRGHVFEVYKDCPNITSGQLKVLFIELT